MKNNKRFYLIALICMVMISSKSFAQFEQKFTFQASTGIVKLTDTGEDEVGSYFSAGISADAGVQYNYSRSLSFVGLIKYVTFFDNDTDPTYSEKLNSFSLNICPKYRFMTSKKVNPFVFAGVGLSIVNYKYYEVGYGDESYKFPATFNYALGAGFDVSLNENLALFLQGGFNFTDLKDEGYTLPYNTMFIQVGLNINLFKSKSL